MVGVWCGLEPERDGSNLLTELLAEADEVVIFLLDLMFAGDGGLDEFTTDLPVAIAHPMEVDIQGVDRDSEAGGDGVANRLGGGFGHEKLQFVKQGRLGGLGVLAFELEESPFEDQPGPVSIKQSFGRLRLNLELIRELGGEEIQRNGFLPGAAALLGCIARPHAVDEVLEGLAEVTAEFPAPFAEPAKGSLAEQFAEETLGEILGILG